MSEQKQKVVMWSEPEIRKILEPAHRPFMQVVKKDGSKLVWQREADYAVAMVERDVYFRKCPEASLVEAVKNVAFLGLSLNPARQHAVIVPRYDKKLEHYVASLLVMYRGFTHLATEAGVRGIKAEVVYQADHFKYGSSSERGGDWYEYQVEANEERGTPKNAFLGTFVAATMPAGSLKVEWLTARDVYKIRDMSESYLDAQGSPRRNSPWHVDKWFDEMAKKAGVKRAFKRWEEMMIDAEKWDRFLAAIKIDNETEGVLNEKIENLPPEDVVTCLSKEQIKDIRTLAPTPGFIKKICQAYAVSSLDKIDARRYGEIQERIKAAREANEARKAQKAQS